MPHPYWLAYLAAQGRGLSPWRIFTMCVLMVSAALSIRQGLEPFMPHGVPMLLLLLPVVSAAALDGGWAALVTTVLAAGGSTDFPLRLLYDPAIPHNPSGVNLSLFLVIGALIGLVVGRQTRLVGELTEEVAALHKIDERRLLQLQETNHRFRNDLAVGAAMLQLRSKNAQSRETKDALCDAIRHFRALASIHTTLHVAGRKHGEEGSLIDSREFIARLGRQLWSALTSEGLRRIPIDIQAEAHALSLEQSVQLGLVINEATTNAFKYAFPAEREGRISIRFCRVGAEYRLVITDDGIGLPPAAPDPRAAGGMGSRLLRSLARQLGGSFSREAGPRGIGTICQVRFPAIDPPALQLQPKPSRRRRLVTWFTRRSTIGPALHRDGGAERDEVAAQREARGVDRPLEPHHRARYAEVWHQPGRLGLTRLGLQELQERRLQAANRA